MCIELAGYMRTTLVERPRSLELYAKDSRTVILADESKVPVRRAGYQRLRELL
jgi:hypothetical protein